MVSVRNLINFCWGVGGQQLVHFIDKQPKKHCSSFSLPIFSLLLCHYSKPVTQKFKILQKRIFVTGALTQTQKCDEGQWHPVAWLLGCRHCSKCYLVVLVASLLLCVCVHMHPHSFHFVQCVYVFGVNSLTMTTKMNAFSSLAPISPSIRFAINTAVYRPDKNTKLQLYQPSLILFLLSWNQFDKLQTSVVTIANKSNYSTTYPSNCLNSLLV